MILSDLAILQSTVHGEEDRVPSEDSRYLLEAGKDLSLICLRPFRSK